MVDVKRTRLCGPAKFAAVVLASLGAASCGSKGTVAVTAAIQDPKLTISTPSALASKLDGGFSLHLELGQLAGSGSDISIQQGAFRVARASDSSPLFDIEYSAWPPPPPNFDYHLSPGKQLDLAVTVANRVDGSGQALTAGEAALLCGAGMLQFTGSFEDSTSGQVTVNSLAFAVEGCP